MLLFLLQTLCSEMEDDFLKGCSHCYPSNTSLSAWRFVLVDAGARSREPGILPDTIHEGLEFLVYLPPKEPKHRESILKDFLQDRSARISQKQVRRSRRIGPPPDGVQRARPVAAGISCDMPHTVNTATNAGALDGISYRVFFQWLSGGIVARQQLRVAILIDPSALNGDGAWRRLDAGLDVVARFGPSACVANAPS